MIVDDASNPRFLSNITLWKTLVVHSEYTHHCGILLAYAQFLQYPIASVVMF